MASEEGSNSNFEAHTSPPAGETRPIRQASRNLLNGVVQAGGSIEEDANDHDEESYSEDDATDRAVYEDAEEEEEDYPTPSKKIRKGNSSRGESSKRLFPVKPHLPTAPIPSPFKKENVELWRDQLSAWAATDTEQNHLPSAYETTLIDAAIIENQRPPSQPVNGPSATNLFNIYAYLASLFQPGSEISNTPIRLDQAEATAVRFLFAQLYNGVKNNGLPFYNVVYDEIHSRRQQQQPRHMENVIEPVSKPTEPANDDLPSMDAAIIATDSSSSSTPASGNTARDSSSTGGDASITAVAGVADASIAADAAVASPSSHTINRNRSQRATPNPLMIRSLYLTPLSRNRYSSTKKTASTTKSNGKIRSDTNSELDNNIETNSGGELTATSRPSRRTRQQRQPLTPQPSTQEAQPEQQQPQQQQQIQLSRGNSPAVTPPGTPRGRGRPRKYPKLLLEQVTLTNTTLPQVNKLPPAVVALQPQAQAEATPTPVEADNDNRGSEHQQPSSDDTITPRPAGIILTVVDSL